MVDKHNDVEKTRNGGISLTYITIPLPYFKKDHL